MGGFKREPVAYALGEDEFKLFELVPKAGAGLMAGDVVYIGKDVDQRDHILHVKRRVTFEEITAGAQRELPTIIEEIIRKKEDKFLEFYNRAEAITTRFHMLELLPGLGKKSMWAILEERKKGPFTDFEDLSNRVPMVHHPVKLLEKRIFQEIAEPEQKYHLFVAR